MQCLKIENGKGYFFTKEKQWQEIDKITKDDILWLLDVETSPQESFEMDAMEDNLKNEAHKIIYQSLYEKFEELKKNKNKFLDECEEAYKKALQKYK